MSRSKAVARRKGLSLKKTSGKLKKGYRYAKGGKIVKVKG